MLKIRFKFRKSSNPAIKTGILQCCISYNKVSAPPFSTGIVVFKKKWDSKNQFISGLADTDNKTLIRIKDEIKEILEECIRAGKTVSAKTLKDLYCREEMTTPCLSIVYQEYLKELQKKVQRKEIVPKTANHWQSSFRNLQMFLETNNLKNIMPGEFTPKIKTAFEHYLKTRSATGKFRPLSHNSTMIELQKIRTVIDYAVQQEYIQFNPLASEKFSFKLTDEIHFLTVPELEVLAGTVFHAQVLSQAKDYFLFQCYTGFSYIDAKSFQEDRHVIKKDGTEYIKLKRQKSKVEQFLPYLPDAKEIYRKYSGKLMLFALGTYNRYLQEIFAIMGLDGERIEKLRSHSGRKSSGSYFLEKTGSLEVTAKILGHKNLQTTQKHYARVSEKMVENAFKED